MKFKNALENISKAHEKDTLNTLYTPRGENLDRQHVCEDHQKMAMRILSFSIYCIIIER